MSEKRVVLVEPDLFSRSWAMMLLARDWRTTVCAEVESGAGLLTALKTPVINASLALVSANLLKKEPASYWNDLARLSHCPEMLILGSVEDLDNTRVLHLPGFSGWLVKNEISDSLAWAVAEASAMRWAATPASEPVLYRANPSKPLIVFDGRERPCLDNLTPEEARFARLAFICSMERSELAREKFLQVSWTNSKVSGIYDKLGLHDLQDCIDLLGEELNQYIMPTKAMNDPANQGGRQKKRTDMESLAFHVITRPAVRNVR